MMFYMSKRFLITTIIFPSIFFSELVIVLINNQREFPGELAFT